MKKEFSKFFIASLKRTAQNVSPLLVRKQKLIEKVNELNSEITSIEAQLTAYDAPIKEMTGGYSIEDLVKREIETFTDKEGKTIKKAKWVLKYPDTIVPSCENERTLSNYVDDSVDDTKDTIMNVEFNEENNNVLEEREA